MGVDGSLKSLWRHRMGTLDKQGVVTMQELVVSSLAQTDALTKLLIEKGPHYRGRVYAEAVG